MVLGDVGDELVSTAGVAVRPFWWSDECLAALGHGGGQPGAGGAGAGGSGDAETGSGLEGGAHAGSTSDSSIAGGEHTGGPAASLNGVGRDGSGSEGDADSEAFPQGSVDAQRTGLGGGWIALIAALAVIAAAGLAAAGYLLWRARRPAGGAIAAEDMGVQAVVPPVAAGPAATRDRSGPAYCSQCGARLEPDDKFCVSCGRRL